MNETSNHRIAEVPDRWALRLMVIAIIAFALIMFRQVLVPGVCLFTTDDNIGQMQFAKNGISVLATGNYTDTSLVGMPGGAVSIMGWNAWMVWLLPNRFYINWMHALNLVLASVFLTMFLRRQGAGWAAICLACLTTFWLGSNLTLTYAGHLGKFGLLMVASVALYCISRALARQTSILWGILAGGVLAFMLMEQLDVALFFGLALGAYALFLAIRQWQAHGTWAKSAVAIILMVGMPLLISATMMFVSYASNIKGAASMQTESAREKWEYVTQWSWPPDESIDFIAPGYMGWRSGELAGPYWGQMGRSAGWEQTRQGFMNFKLENTYLGIIPILLALFAVLMAIMGRKANAECRMKNAELAESGGSARSREWTTADSGRRAEIIFWACVAVITLLLAFGKFFPLYALFYKLPLVNSIRNPNKFLQVFQLALGILTAYGLDGMLRWKRVERGVEARGA